MKDLTPEQLAAAMKAIRAPEEPQPLSSIEAQLFASTRDWSLDQCDAWLWGIVNGYDDRQMKDRQQRFNWSDEQVAVLRAYNKRFEELARAEEENARKAAPTADPNPSPR